MIKILFANSDPKLSEIYTSHMRPYFNVDSAHDGLSALRKWKSSRHALIVSDYDLPWISGITLLQFVRNHPTLSSTPFVFLSNYADNTRALNLGANDWIDTHFAHPDFLLDRIHHHLKANRYVQIN
jgi:CheY-like chemotaxis protein